MSVIAPDGKWAAQWIMLGVLLGVGSSVLAAVVTVFVLVWRRGLWRAIAAAGATLGGGLLATVGLVLVGVLIWLLMAGAGK